MKHLLLSFLLAAALLLGGTTTSMVGGGTTSYDFEELGSNMTFTSDGINSSLSGNMVGVNITALGSSSPPSVTEQMK